MKIKLGFACVATAALLVFAAFGGAVTPAKAANNSQQTGLVNVSLGDVALLNNVNLALAANVAATVCNVTVPVAVLATQVVGQSGDYTCDTAAGPLTIDQALNGPAAGTPSAGGNNSRQAGLVNVSLGDVDILNNVNAAVGANIAVTACNLTIPVAVLAAQLVGQTGDYSCTTTSGPLTIAQSQ